MTFPDFNVDIKVGVGCKVYAYGGPAISVGAKFSANYSTSPPMTGGQITGGGCLPVVLGIRPCASVSTGEGISYGAGGGAAAYLSYTLQAPVSKIRGWLQSLRP